MKTAFLETITVGGFRVWHLIACCSGICLIIVIIVCCCIRFRIPRTKQDIEADYQRKQIIKKFREKLQQIKNSEMDNMDLLKVIGRIQSDYISSNISTENIQHCKEQEINSKFKNSIQNPA